MKQLRHEKHDLEVRIKAYEEERVKFEEERQEWGAEMERNHQDILEQNDRLTVVSQTLAGTKVRNICKLVGCGLWCLCN